MRQMFDDNEQGSYGYGDEERPHDDRDYVTPYTGDDDTYYSAEKLSVRPVSRPPYGKILSLILCIVLGIGLFGWWQTSHATPQPTQTTTIHQAPPVKHQPTIAVSSSLVGQTALVPQNAAVNTVDGGICWVSFGGKITVRQDNGKNVIVSYRPPAEPAVPANLSCASGEQYQMPQTSFLKSNDQYLAQEQALAQDRKTVVKILSKNYYGPEIPVSGYKWVVAENQTPVYRTFDNTSVQQGMSCTIGSAPDGSTQGGNEQERGRAPDGRTLYMYVPDGQQTYGSECPKGTLFFQQ